MLRNACPHISEIDKLDNSIDQFSQYLLVSQIETLLNYSARFYNRQFITRKITNNGLIIEMESYLSEFFDGEKALLTGPPFG